MWGVEHVAPISLTGGSEVAGRGALYCLLLPHFLLVSCATVVKSSRDTTLLTWLSW